MAQLWRVKLNKAMYGVVVENGKVVESGLHWMIGYAIVAIGKWAEGKGGWMDMVADAPRSNKTIAKRTDKSSLAREGTNGDTTKIHRNTAETHQTNTNTHAMKHVVSSKSAPCTRGLNR